MNQLTLEQTMCLFLKCFLLIPLLFFSYMSFGQEPPSGMAMQFGGPNDFIELGQIDLVSDDNPNGNWTIELWFKRSELQNYENLVHTDFDFARGSNRGVRVELNQGVGRWGSLGKLYIGGMPGTPKFLKSDATFEDKWYHIAMVGDNTNSTFSWYLNGEKVSSLNGRSPSSFPKFVLGIGFTNIADRDFNGLIDEFRVWNKARSGAEIQRDFTKKLSGRESGLIRYYDFGQTGVTAGGVNNGITKVIDKSGNGDGTLRNFTLNGEVSNFVSNGVPHSADCSVPATLFSAGAYTGEMVQFQSSGEQKFGNSEISSVQSVEVSPGWHVAISEDEGEKIQFEDNMAETDEAVTSETNVLLARRLNTYDEDNSCMNYVYLAVNSIIRNNIIVSRVKMGDPMAKVIGTIPSHTKGLWVAAADMGDILTFSFAKEETDFKIPSIPVSDYVDEIYELVPEIQWKDARSRYQRVSNATASRSSFDAIYIPPAFIDKPQAEGGGIRGQIFNDLRESDTDWRAIDGDIALKNQFSLMVINEGSGSKVSKSVYSKQNFKESFSFNIGAEVTAPIPQVPAVRATPSGSYGYSESTEKTWEENHVYTFSRISNKVYNIDLVPQKMDFSRDFISAIRRLPVPGEASVTSFEAAKNDPAWNAYYDTFIKTWGTHYPAQVTYGGFFVGVAHESLESYAQKDYSKEEFTAGLELDATAEVSAGAKGVEVSKEVGAKGSVSGGAAWEDEKSMQTSNGQVSYNFLFRGGEGSSFDNYAVGDAVQPTDIQLKSLDNLLKDEYFKQEIPGLALKAKFLAFAINEYIKDNRDKGTKPLPLAEMYEMTVSEIVVNSCDGDGTGDEDVEFTGEVWASQGSVSSELGDGQRIWDEDEKEFDCEDDCPKTFSLNNRKYMVYVTPDASGNMDRGDKGFQLKAKFKEEDSGLNPDDDLGEQYRNIKVADITSTSLQDFNLQFNRDGFDITVKSKIRKIPLSELGIDLHSNNVQVD
jgi:hypothetical protein